MFSLMRSSLISWGEVIHPSFLALTVSKGDRMQKWQRLTTKGAAMNEQRQPRECAVRAALIRKFPGGEEVVEILHSRKHVERLRKLRLECW